MLNRRGQAIAITLLVVLTLVLTVTSLYYFLSNDKVFNDNIDKVSAIDEVYLQESLINSQIQTIFDSATKTINKNDAKEVFIERFSKELDKYNEKTLGNVADQLREQLKESNIETNDQKLVFNVEIEISKSKAEVKGGRELIKVNYKYKKSFEKVFK